MLGVRVEICVAVPWYACHAMLVHALPRSGARVWACVRVRCWRASSSAHVPCSASLLFAAGARACSSCWCACMFCSRVRAMRTRVRMCIPQARTCTCARRECVCGRAMCFLYLRCLCQHVADKNLCTKVSATKQVLVALSRMAEP